MKNNKKQVSIFSFIALAVFLLNACTSLRNSVSPEVYPGSNNPACTTPDYNPAKKTVLIIADNDGTEMFDMMAPFYLFSATENANVYAWMEII